MRFSRHARILLFLKSPQCHGGVFEGLVLIADKEQHMYVHEGNLHRTGEFPRRFAAEPP